VVGRGDTVELLFTRSRTLSTQSLRYVVNNIALAREVLAAEAAGFDGVMLAASVDPGLDESRSVARIPVVGSMESALALSQFIGRKAGIVTTPGGEEAQAYIRIIEQNAIRYGCRDKLIANRPVRTFNQSHAQFYSSFSKAVSGDADEFMSAFDATARELVRDGADVIICGNQLFGAVLEGRLARTSDNVPIIDNAAAGLKMLQTLISLRNSIGLDVSRAGVFQAPTAESMKSVTELLSTLSDAIARSGNG
jgi:Asp/Glu/hydantoin racemase